MELPSPNTQLEELFAFLAARVDYEQTSEIPYRLRGFRLDRMRRLMARLGDPHLHLNVLHVAGTKGKGSTAAMIAQALTAAGYRTGLHTSPHLERLEERFTVDNCLCSAQELAGLLGRLREVAESMDQEPTAREGAAPGPTYFEITTAMAFLHFARCGVDAAIVEVGLGGRLDATNVCEPLAAVITSISRDHTKQLGDNLASIAREKAGIIKEKIPVISGVTQPEPRQVIHQVARRLDCPLHQLDEDFFFRYHPPSAPDSPPRMDYWQSPDAPPLQLEELSLGMLGRHQAANAAVALATLDSLRQMGWDIPASALREGLAAAHCPARVELAMRQPAVVLDAAHNDASLEALLATLHENFTPRRRVAIFGSSRDKDTAAMLRLLLPDFDLVILTCYLNNPRGAQPEELFEIARKLTADARAQGRSIAEIRVCDEPAVAWRDAVSGITREDLVCVVGSFFLVAELRPELERWRAEGSP